MTGSVANAPANWKKPKPRAGKLPANERLRLALEKIANGDNDPRTTAKEALGWIEGDARP